eukprot:751278-Amphidinium_carterae.1
MQGTLRHLGQYNIQDASAKRRKNLSFSKMVSSACWATVLPALEIGQGGENNQPSITESLEMPKVFARIDLCCEHMYPLEPIVLDK